MSTASRRAFITGVYGQDGSYLAEYLLSLGYIVKGLIHANDVVPIGFHQNHENFSVSEGDFADIHSYESVLESFAPDEIYNLAAISDLKTARENPERTKQVNLIGFGNLVVSAVALNPRVRIFHALSSRMLVPDKCGVITETSELAIPQNAYDETKRTAYEQIILPYRENGFFVTSGFLCNHESPRRDARFVTGKIAVSVVKIAKGEEDVLYVGNVASRRDWSFAGDFVCGMHAVMQVDVPRDYVFASGVLHTVQDFIDTAFRTVGISIRWDGEGQSICGYDASGCLRVEVSPDHYQKDDNSVLGDSTLLKKTTGWGPVVSFEELVSMMVRSELERL